MEKGKHDAGVAGKSVVGMRTIRGADTRADTSIRLPDAAHIDDRFPILSGNSYRLVMPHSASPAGPFALGTFRAGGREFAGLVVGDRVHPIDDAAGLHLPSVRQLLEHWDAVRPELAARAEGRPDNGFALDAVDVLAPVEPRQIFQSGANYRTHVIDLAAADRKPGDTRSAEEVRAEIGRLQDERSRSGEPYVFIGAVSAMCGPYDDVVLPTGPARTTGSWSWRP